MWWISGWFLLYAIAIFGLVFGIERLRSGRRLQKAVSIDQVSVVVPFRNEAHNLENFLNCLRSQKYQPVQWILVDDHSTDDYKKHFAALAEYRFPVRLLHLPDDQSGKKQAIRYGADHVTTDYCLTMDADVTFGSDYMKEMLGVPAADLVILPVRMTSKKWWHPFFTLEYLFTSLINKGIAGWARPVNASGANMLFRVDAFGETDDIADHGHIASGDDIYTLRAFRDNNKSIEIVENPQLTVFTATPSTIGEVMEQRVRWLGKSGHVGDSLNNFLGIFAVALHLGFFLLAIMTLAAPVYWLFALIVTVKGALDYVLVRTSREKIDAELIAGLLLFELFYPVYLFGLAGALMFSQPEWKGR
jgi:cellulose synthase/poly-beta-1,6-N-acetylglucosamine synthase-like glycosyltransferase